MCEKDYNEDNLLTVQFYVLFFSLLSIIISILTTYNQKLAVEKRKVIFKPKVARNVSLFNRILIFIIAIIFLYINYQLFVLNKGNKDGGKNEKLQVSASILVVISAIITLYIVYTSSTETVIDVENPLI